MSIGTLAFGGAQAAQGPQATQAPSGHHGHGMVKQVAGALGMSTSDLRSELKSGKSLDDVAQEKGVSHADLVAAVKKGLPQDVQSSANADQVAEDISTRKGLPTRGAGGPSGAGGRDRDGDNDGSGSGSNALSGVLGGSLTSSQSKVLDALSSALGTDTTSLVSQLQSGTSLSDLVSAKGVDSSKLADILQNGLMFDAKA